MNTKNIYYWMSALILSVTCLYSCSDKETLAVATSPTEDAFAFKASASDITLSETNASTHQAVTLQWDSLAYGISTPVTFTIQMDSVNGDFSKPLEEEIATNKFATSYTDSVLNLKALKLKLKPNVAGQIKVRLKSNLAFSQMPAYSKVLTLNVTPYKVAQQIGYLYMPDLNEKLCSLNNNGKYEGYVQANQWTNFELYTGANWGGTIYGSTPNSLYSLDAGSDKWKIWFDEGGYFLLKANMNTLTWSKTAITSVCVTGDFNGWSLTANPMTYDATNKVWTATCDISKIGYGMKIILNQNWDFFYGSNDAGVLTLGAANIIPASTGTKTVTMNLSNPEKYTYTIQ